MYSRSLKYWLGHIHVPRRDNIAVHMSHWVHDPRFRLSIMLLGLLLSFILFGLWVGISGRSENPGLVSPLFPYGY